MNTADSSVLVAGFATWHERHQAARAAVQACDLLVGHAATETFSVLTRLPPPRRAHPELVAAFLARHFPNPPVVLDGSGYQRLLAAGVEHRILGGTIYDALIGLTAASHSARLMTLDTRATPAYRAVGADHQLLD